MTSSHTDWTQDPENPGHLRNDTDWSRPHQLGAVKPASEYAVPRQMPRSENFRAAADGLTTSAKITPREKDRQVRKNNLLGWIGCLLATLSLFFNPVAVLSILAIIFSSIGVAKASDLDDKGKASGRGTSLTGLIIGIVGLICFAWKMTQLVA
ncbi:MAG: DUF4190 domain-containing protein [Kineosporiaceae bacterium]|nr:DUF4190 domain-containing protein [Aeromicrobium sp.]